MGAKTGAETTRRRVAILGATGLVGRTLLEILEQRDFPIESLSLLASGQGSQRSLSFRGGTLPIEAVTERSFDGIHLALFAVGADLARRWAVPARAAGAQVVDNSNAHRLEADVPLVVPEVNADALTSRPWLVANPNCSTIALVMALKPLADHAGLARVVVSTYQAASGAGAEALERLEQGVQRPPARAAASDGASLAFNVIPHIDRFEANGYTREEMKIVHETRKILALPELPITATAVRVPVRVGHSAAVNVTLSRPLTCDRARELWRDFPGIEVVDDPEHHRYPMPVDAAGKDEVLVGRTRRDLSQTNGLDFFVVSDNLRKGAALNAVQIAEVLSRSQVRT